MDDPRCMRSMTMAWKCEYLYIMKVNMENTTLLMPSISSLWSIQIFDNRLQ